MQIIPAAISALISAIAIAFAFYQFRRSQYRTDKVADWANDGIDALQRLNILISDKGGIVTEEEKRRQISEICMRTSVLVEMGRLFFKNEIKGDGHGAGRPPAYRGYRPIILDPLVLGHEICRDWMNASADRREHLGRIAFDNVREFVSMAQKEVGRGKASSYEPAQGGSGFNLEKMITELQARNAHVGD